MPCVARLSVRAIRTKWGSRRAASAARSFCTISPAGMTSWPEKWPQRFGLTWSSSWMPAAPAPSNSRTVRITLSGLP